MEDPGFRYLNRENRWPGFALDGLEIGAAGALTLAPLPAFSPGPPPAAALSGPAGIGVDSAGNLYVADPDGDRILRIDGCDGTSAPLPCRGSGWLPGQLSRPRGALVGPRGALYVADSGNHRVQVFDLPGGQLRALWGQPDPYGPPAPSDAPGRLDEPWDLAADQAGRVYVAERGNRRVQQFDADGRVQPAFWETMLQSWPDGPPPQPAWVATGLIDGAERLLLIDAARDQVLVFDSAGGYDPDATARWESLAGAALAGLAYDGQRLYVGDQAAGRVLVFDLQGRLVGQAAGYRGPLAGLGLDCRGRLLIHTGAGSVAQALPGPAYRTGGSFLAGPIRVSNQPTRWQRLQVQADLPAGAHLQLYTCTLDTSAAPPPLPAPGEQPSGPASSPWGVWRAAPRDALDILALNQPGQYLWVAGLLQSEGRQTPAVEQIRIDFDRDGWLSHLPAIYSREPQAAVFLERALALFESLAADEGRLIDRLPLLADPDAAPDTRPGGWLDWLSGWLAFPLAETWDTAKRRAALAEAFGLAGRRGTVAGLRRMLELYAGVSARIEEPGRFAAVWSLGQSELGFETSLAAGPPQGAVLGVTATVDQSSLDDAGAGVPLFAALTNHFQVELYAAGLPPDALEQARLVIEREKPAHTTYEICLLGPHMRVGAQARLGIDTIVAGPPAGLVLGGERPLGVDSALPERTGGASLLGPDTRLGRRTSLT